jgi:ribonuclease-3
MKTFTAQVRVGDGLYGNGVGRSKKEAEQEAAEKAYSELSELALDSLASATDD